MMNKIRKGKITLVENDQKMQFGETSAEAILQVKINVWHPRFYTNVVIGGSIGAAEAYIVGLWRTDNLTNIIRIVILNQQIFTDLDKGWARLMEPINAAFHMLNKNTRSGSRQNIVAHYDLGNDFYELFLDETMTYSCGIFQNENSSLKEASVEKYDRICRKLKLEPGERIVEIGTGWGGFAAHAVLNYDVHVTTTTISDRQHQYAKERFKTAGIENRVRLLKKDYRDLEGRFDKLVSIEMIEAVGHQYLSTFFKHCSRLLKDDGLMALQAITIADQSFDRHKRSVDFIKRYIFPGSCIPSVTAIGKAITRGTDLRIVHLEDITAHYARTLREWRHRFFANIEAVRTLGFEGNFIRMWEYYLSYCEAGFIERYLGDVQMILAKHGYRKSIYPN
jgi:cyclopropane-fatty-acyl-phospholipid synthase